MTYKSLIGLLLDAGATCRPLIRQEPQHRPSESREGFVLMIPEDDGAAR